MFMLLSDLPFCKTYAKMEKIQFQKKVIIISDIRQSILPIKKIIKKKHIKKQNTHVVLHTHY